MKTVLAPLEWDHIERLQCVRGQLQPGGQKGGHGGLICRKVERSYKKQFLRGTKEKKCSPEDGSYI